MAFANPFPTQTSGVSPVPSGTGNSGFINPFVKETRGTPTSTPPPSPFANFNETLNAQNNRPQPIKTVQAPSKGFQIGDLVTGAENAIGGAIKNVETTIKGLTFNIKPPSQESSKQTKSPIDTNKILDSFNNALTYTPGIGLVTQTVKNAQKTMDVIEGFLKQNNAPSPFLGQEANKGKTPFSPKNNEQKIGAFLNDFGASFLVGQASGLNQAVEGLTSAVGTSVKSSEFIAPKLGFIQDALDKFATEGQGKFAKFMNDLSPLKITIQDLKDVNGVNGATATPEQLVRYQKVVELADKTGVSISDIVNASDNVNPATKVYDFIKNAVDSFTRAIKSTVTPEEQKLLDSGVKSGLEKAVAPGEYTPGNLITKVVDGGIDNTPEGKQIIKMATDASNKGQNVLVSPQISAQSPTLSPAKAMTPLEAKTKVIPLESKLKDVLVANRQPVEEALSQVWQELEVAEPGQRIFIQNPDSSSPTIKGIASTFPSWVPSDLRSRALFDKVMTPLANLVDNPSYPVSPKLRDLYDTVLGEIDIRAGIDTSETRGAIMDVYNGNQNIKTEGSQNAQGINQNNQNQIRSSTQGSEDENPFAESPTPKSSSQGKRTNQRRELANTTGGKTIGNRSTGNVPESVSNTFGNGTKLGKVPEPPKVNEPGHLQSAAAGINPGIGKFYQEDIRKIAQGTQTIGKELSDVFNPPNASKPARYAADLIREQKATVANKAIIEARQMKDVTNYFNKFTDKQNVDNISSYERTGKFDNAPEGYSELYKKSMESSRAIMQSVYGDDKVGLVENYIRRSFKFASSKDEIEGTKFLVNNTSGTLGASKSPLKSRVLKMPLDEALQNMKDRGINVKMATTNPELLRQWSMANAQKALAFNITLNKAVDSGLIKFVSGTSEIPEGMIAATDRAFQSFYPRGAQFAVRGNFYGDPHVMRIFNNAVSRGLEGSQIANTYSALRTIKNTMNQFNLGLSAFHFTATAINSSLIDASLAARNLLQGKPVPAIARFARAGIPFGSLTNNMWRGYKFMKSLEANDPTMFKILEDQVNKGGARLGITNEYRTAMVDKMETAFRNGNILGAAIRVPSAFIDWTSSLLMENIVPYNKLGAYLDKAANIAERLPADATEEQIRRAYTQAQSSIDNIFGQMVYDNLFWNKTFKDILQLTTRSVGWSFGTIGEFGGAFKDVVNMARGKTGSEFENGLGKIPLGERFTDRTMHALMLPVLAGLMGAMYQYLHTGKGTQELKDYFYPLDGGVDKSGNPTRASLPTYMKDLFAYGTDPLGTIANKTSGLLSTVIDLIGNKNYYGDLIRNPNDSVGTQLSQVGQFLINQVMPFSISQFEQSLTDKTTTGERKIEGFFGLLRAPQKFTQSTKEQDIFNASTKLRGEQGARTPEEVAINKLKSQARDDINNGIKPSESKAFQELVKNGTLDTSVKQRNFVKSAPLTPAERVLKTLPKSTKQQIQNGKQSNTDVISKVNNLLGSLTTPVNASDGKAISGVTVKGSNVVTTYADGTTSSRGINSNLDLGQQIGKVIYEIGKSLGWTQSDLSKSLGYVPPAEQKATIQRFSDTLQKQGGTNKIQIGWKDSANGEGYIPVFNTDKVAPQYKTLPGAKPLPAPSAKSGNSDTGAPPNPYKGLVSKHFPDPAIANQISNTMFGESSYDPRNVHFNDTGTNIHIPENATQADWNKIEAQHSGDKAIDVGLLQIDKTPVMTKYLDSKGLTYFDLLDPEKNLQIASDLYYGKIPYMAAGITNWNAAKGLGYWPKK
jgi:hypothetical protein